MRGHAADEEQVRQDVDNVCAPQLARDADRQTFTGKLVDDIEHPEGPSVVRAVVDEVIRPDMVWPFGAQPNARAVVQPEPLALRLFGWNLQPFTLPDPFNTLVVHGPAGASQKFCNPAVAIAAVVTGKCDDVGRQPFFIVSTSWLLALCRTVLAEHRAKPALGDTEQTPDVLNAPPAT